MLLVYIGGWCLKMRVDKERRTQLGDCRMCNVYSVLNKLWKLFLCDTFHMPPTPRKQNVHWRKNLTLVWKWIHLKLHEMACVNQQSALSCKSVKYSSIQVKIEDFAFLAVSNWITSFLEELCYVIKKSSFTDAAVPWDRMLLSFHYWDLKSVVIL